MPSADLDQQDVTALRADDLICIIQGGREKRMLMASLTAWVLNAIGYPIKILLAGVVVAQPLIWRGSGNLISGSVQFNLTDGAGAALFANVHNVNIVLNNASQIYATGWSLSADRKLLTVTVNQLLLSALVLIYQSPPNGTLVRIEVTGE